MATEILARYMKARLGADVQWELIAETIEFLVELSGTTVESHRLTHGVVVADVLDSPPPLQSPTRTTSVPPSEGERWTAFPLELTAFIENMIGRGSVAALVARAAFMVSAEPRGAILAIVDQAASRKPRRCRLSEGPLRPAQ